MTLMAVAHAVDSPKAALPKLVEYASDRCSVKGSTKSNFKVIRKGLPKEDDEGYYKIFFTDYKLEWPLHHADNFINEDNFKRDESLCNMTPVYRRPDGLIWVLGLKDDRPMPGFVVGALFSPKERKILGEFTGDPVGKVNFSGGELYYDSIIQRTDLGGATLKYKGASHTADESELKVVHHVTYNGSKIVDQVDPETSFKRFEYAYLFKDLGEFKKYFALDQKDPKKFKRWLYTILDPFCVYASTERGDPKGEVTDVICKEEH